MPGLDERLRKTVGRAGRVSQTLQDIMGGPAVTASPSLVTQPAPAYVPPEAATSVGSAGPVGTSEAEPGFLATWWPALAALAVGAGAFFGFDLGVWWSLGIAVVAFIVLRVGMAFLGG